MSKVQKFLGIVLLVVCLVGCASSPTNNKSVISERQERMFWEITSPTGTTVYVLGTIHVGTEEIANLPQGILDAFDSSNHLYAELALADMQNQQNYLTPIMEETVIVDEEGIPIPLTMLLDEAAADCLSQIIVSTVGADNPEAFTSMTCLPPWFWTSTLALSSYQTMGYNAEHGIDVLLYNRGFSAGKEILGLDAMETQLKILAFGTADEQLALLQELLHNIIDKKLDEFEIINQMVAAYLEDNRSEVKRIVQQSIQDEMEAAGADYIEAYTDMVYTQRNRSWADQITTMLQQEDETYFIFAGAAHWLADDSVFNMLVEDGIARWQ